MSVKKHPMCRSGFYVDPDFFLYQHESGRRIYSAEAEGAAVKRPNRLFTKNTGLCEVVRRRIGADACPVPEGYVEVLGLRPKAPKLSPGKRRP